MPYPLPYQMLDSLEGYLDNIAVAATQAVAKGGPIADPRDLNRHSGGTTKVN